MITSESAKTIFVGSGAGMCEGECICEDVYMNTDLHVYMHVHVLLRMRCNLEFDEKLSNKHSQPCTCWRSVTADFFS